MEVEEEQGSTKLQYDRLLNDPNLKEMYTDNVKSRHKKLNENGNSQLDTLRETLVTSANEINPKKTRQRKMKWMKHST